MNVVTGTSARGKSAIGHIIDYCLGSGKCAIPVGIIRETVAWYALVIELRDSFMFVARREPEAQQSTDDFCVFEGPNLSIPLFPEKNQPRSAFKAQMDDLANLPRLDIPSGDAEAGFGRASFRDMAAFNFLPQHIVANPQTLFAKTDTTEHREKLRRIFPLVLGVINAAYLLAQHEERDLKMRIQRGQDEVDRRGIAADAWRAELFGLYAHAKEIGLIDKATPQPMTVGGVSAIFRRIVANPQLHDLAAPYTGNTENAVTELRVLNERENSIAASLAQFRRHLRRIQDLAAHLRDYGEQLSEENGRVVGAGWFRDHLKTNACPFCGTENDRASFHVNVLRAASTELEGLAQSVRQAPGGFEREEAQLRVSIRASEDELRQLRTQRKELEDASREAALARQRTSDVYRLVGRIEQSVVNVGQVQGDSDLQKQLDAFRARLRELRAILDAEGFERRLDAAINAVARLVSVPAQAMGLERHNDHIELVPSELTLRFRNVSGRNDYLWEIGSGENWMGYHIAVMLALHQYFLKQAASPVPSFLVIDQPTQVYFPARNDTYDRVKPMAPVEGTMLTGDFAKARRIFEALAAAVIAASGDFQVIVTEHADEMTWGGIDGINLVEDWRDNRYLIPPDWRADMASA